MNIKEYVLNGVTIKEYVADALLADDTLRKQRLDICNTCEYKSDIICNKCYCILKVKVSYKGSSCPERKW